MAKKKRWVVTASGDRPLTDVKEQLTASGFDIDQVLDEIGCITGRANDTTAKQLRSVPGVADVSPELNVDIGPPDAPIS